MKARAAEGRRITKVVITRSRAGNSDLADKLEGLGFEPLPVDTIEFLAPADWSSVDENLERLTEYDWLLINSATGAEFFARRMRELSLPLPWEGKPRVAAVGEKTRAALEREGITVSFVPSEYLNRALAEELPRGLGREVLVLRADVASPELITVLDRAGFRVRDIALYVTSRSHTADLQAVSAVEDAHAVLFASPSAVAALVESLGGSSEPLSRARTLLAVCIGPATAAAARDHGFQRTLTSATHTTEGLVSCLAAAAREAE